MRNLNSWGPMTVLVVVVAIIIVVVGGLVVVTSPDELSFRQYVEALAWLAGGAGLLGVGRGLDRRR